MDDQLDESSCDTIFDDSLDVFSVDESPETGEPTVTVQVPVVTIPSPKKRRSTNSEPRKNCGRPPLRKKFPNLVPTVDSFVKENGFAADGKRRSTVGRSCGVSLNQIQEHLKENLPEVGEVHRTTLLRLTVPPNKKHLASKRYSQSVQAKVPAKKNCVRKESEDAHYYASRVRYRIEMGSKYENCCTMMSCDTMNKLNVGTLAVSRYHQHNRLFPLNDCPDYLDHDFPVGSGYKLTPVGHMFLKSDMRKPVFDEFGRQHFQYPRTGPSTIITRCQKFHPLTIEMHTNDLIPLLREEVSQGKTVCILLVDGGPDWNSKSWSVILYLTRLFKACNLDLLCSTSYGPGQSAYNPIEHLWAPLSRLLTGVTFPDHLPEEEPPMRQTHLSMEQRKVKEIEMFDRALDTLTEYWDGKKFHGFRVTAKVQKCHEKNDPFCDYQDVHELLKRPSKLRERKDILDEFRFALNHCDRRNGEFSIMKCRNSKCGHCTSHPPSREAKVVLDDIFEHGGMPSPSLDPENPSRYRTYVQAMHECFVPADTGLSRFGLKKLGRCNFCPAYVFVSETDLVNHMALFHNVKPHESRSKLKN